VLLEDLRLVYGEGSSSEANESYWAVGRRVHRVTLLALDVDEFVSCQRRWANWYLSGRAHFGGLSDEDLSSIKIPVLIIPGLGETMDLPWRGETVTVRPHPQHTNEDLHRRLPNSELVVLSDHFSPSELSELHENPECDALISPIVNDFIQRVESGAFTPA
jgi:hypothetical protein